MTSHQALLSRDLYLPEVISFKELNGFRAWGTLMSALAIYSVPSTLRAMSVLEFIARSKRGASISEISRNLGLPKSSTYLVLKTLEQEGYLRRSVQSRRFYFGLRLVSLCRNILHNLDLREVARPILTKLMRETGMIVHLAVLEVNQAVIIDRVEPVGSSAGADWIGRRLDVNCTGVGKALAAFLPVDIFEEVITAKRFARHNENTVVSIRGLKSELAKVRQQGYAVDDEEDEIGVRCIGVPILGDDQRAFAAISFAGTTEEIPLERVGPLARVLRQTASEIALQLKTLRGLDLTETEGRIQAGGPSAS
jgi:DNA-binding IclR family transcriptional regulator